MQHNFLVAADGIWGMWSPWNLCDVTCGEGLKRRTRKCKGPEKCIGVSVETTECELKLLSPCDGE